MNIANSELSPLKLSMYYQNDYRTSKYFLLKDLLQYDFLVCKEEEEVRVEVGISKFWRKGMQVLKFAKEFWKKREVIFKGGRFAQFVS